MPKKFAVKPTVFVVEINKQDFEFASPTFKDYETFSATEKEDADLDTKMKSRQEFVLRSVQRAGVDVTLEDIKDMDTPAFVTLFRTIIESAGIKLDAAKVGETKPR